MSAPGQTAGLSVFTDPLIAELNISRVQISTAYLIGTLVGAATMPFVGRLLDRYGVRLVMAAIGVLFGGVLMGLSTVTSLTGLTAGFAGVRMAGQGALSLAATTAVAIHVQRRRGLALGITTAIGSAGISLAPVLLESVVATNGVHVTWRWEAIIVWAVVIPVGLGGLPSRRASEHVVATARTESAKSAVRRSEFTVRQALRTPMFWAISAGLATSGMLSTALAFHQISLLAERGLSASEAAANFIPQMVAALIGTLLVGAVVDVIQPRHGVTVSMLLLAAALLAYPLIGPGWSAAGFGVLLGLASGIVRGVEAAAYTAYFGTAHIGGIRGISTAISVGSTAFGPAFLAIGNDLAGGYQITIVASAALPLLIALLASVTPVPHEPL